MASAVVRATLLCAALMQAIFSSFALEQPPSRLLRPWRCVATSAAVGSIFTSVVTPNCPGASPTTRSLFPGTRKTAEAIAPPGPPTGLSGAVNGTTVTLTWTAPASGGAPTSYVILAGSAPGLSDLANFDTGSALSTFTATNVAPGTYFVRVLARNDSGTSSASNEIAVTVAGSCAAPPGAPTGLAAAVNGNTVTLTWHAPAGGCPPTSYVIQAGSTPGSSNLANFSTGSAATSFVANNVASGVYYVRVLAADAAGTSGASNEILLSVSGCTGPPAAPSGLASLVNGATVTLSWTAASGSPTNYLVDVGSSPGSANLGVIDNGPATSLTASNVAAGTYYVQVRAANACGASTASNTVTVIVGSSAPATVTILHSFTGPDGRIPTAGLVQGADGNFYGTTNNTTTSSAGNVFRLSPAGSFTVLHVFTGPDGAEPTAPLIQASDGNFYGTTAFGGASNVGTVFRMTPSGDVTVLHSFAGRPTDGSVPEAALIQGRDGNAYGTTLTGGSAAFGTVFRITPAGAYTVLYSFTGGADGNGPQASLVQATDGNLYGTANSGGAFNRGTVFRLTPGGAFSLLHAFTGGVDGALPTAALIQGADGNLYGTATVSGGSLSSGGTIFRMTLGGDFTVLHTFSGAASYPAAPLLQASDGNFYGTTNGEGNPSSTGIVFMMTPAGVVTTLHVFAGGVSDGARSYAPLIESNGSGYGTTSRGGSADVGTIFKIGR